MPTLEPSLRDQLAAVIGKENAETGARLIAEAAAKAAIKALAVHLSAPYPHLNDDQKQLRNALRARARQLGDTRHADGQHEIGRLVEQAAYEHWHRMLFARFLAENDLLIHPERKVSVSLADCADFAALEGAEDGWELAGRYASRMLPQIFRPDDPLLGVRFAIDDVKKLERLLNKLPEALFRASDSLGWCYQFWQARKKKEVNASEVKIGADELPAVTQLFTEPYMVQFLLHNTLGAWWVGAGRALPVEMPYLRVLDDGTPAAGTFEGWPGLARELKVLDPCCGSGHFLVAAFEILVAFRVAEEGLSAREACDAVLRDNLFGLEIDARCVQIAAFALAMAAWTYPEAEGYRPLAPMNVACSGLAISAKKEEWERLGGDDARLRAGMGRMWELFSDAPVLGSLIDPTRDAPSSLFVAGFRELEPLVTRAMRAESTPDDHESHIAAQGLAKAGELLDSRYHLVITNVPYLHRNKHTIVLRDYCANKLPDSKADIATAMLDRITAGLLHEGGSVASVAPQTWLFLDSYKAIRKRLLSDLRWPMLVRLGAGAFRTITGEVVDVILVTLSREADRVGVYIDVADADGPQDRAFRLLSEEMCPLVQADQLRNPDSRVIFGEVQRGELLSNLASSIHGQGSFDDPSFVRCFWERLAVDGGWVRQQTSGTSDAHDSGLTNIFLWENGEGRLARLMALKAQDGYTTGKWRAGIQAWGRRGVAISGMGRLYVNRYSGESFDTNVAVVYPHKDADFPAIYAFCRSEEFVSSVRMIDRKPKVTPNTFSKVPFDVSRWRDEAIRQFPDGVPTSCSSDPTQWVFNGNPRTSDAPLQVAAARLLGFRWPDQQPDDLDTLADKDGIVCIPALCGERPAVDRLSDLLAATWGKEWHPQTVADLLASVGHIETLEDWLRDAFFKQHCELFHHRPFIWHVWDGHREGFSALVNYHRLDHEGLKSLTYTYLGEWIRTQTIDAQAGKSGAGDKLAKAKVLQQRLDAIVTGEAPLDIFVRWKPIEQQPIGWHPDLDDGVRLNIRPFLTVADVGAKGAGVLRWKPNIKGGVDRGKNPPGSPWGEDRDNDRHVTLSAKRASSVQSDKATVEENANDESDDERRPAWLVRAIELHHVGPLHHVEVRLGDKLTLITGENGLGKSLLLDVLWWTLTGHWEGGIIFPTLRSDGGFTDGTPGIRVSMEATMSGSVDVDIADIHAVFDAEVPAWRRTVPLMGLDGAVPIVVVYLRVNGEISVFDSTFSTDHPDGAVWRLSTEGRWQAAAQPDETKETGSVSRAGMYDEWLDWQKHHTDLFQSLRSVLRNLSSPDDLLIPGSPMTLRGSTATIQPSLAMQSGDIPLSLASAAVRRMTTLAYAITKGWVDHVGHAHGRGMSPARRLIVIADEPELHLHPKWQRVLVPSLLTVLRDIGNAPEVQLIMATHSPLVMASVEALFDSSQDSLYRFSRQETNNEVSVEQLQFAKQGLVTHWLVSDVFDATPPRSEESDEAIRAASYYMRGQIVEALAALNSQISEADELGADGLDPDLLRNKIHQALLKHLPDHDAFWPRWIVHVERALSSSAEEEK